MLLFDLVHQDVGASSLSDFIIDQGPRYWSEEEHVEEYKHSEEDIIWLVELNGWGLVIRKVIIRGQSIHLIDHIAEVLEVTLIEVIPCGSIWEVFIYERVIKLKSHGAYKGKADNDYRVEYQKNDDYFIGWN